MRVDWAAIGDIYHISQEASWEIGVIRRDEKEEFEEEKINHAVIALNTVIKRGVVFNERGNKGSKKNGDIIQLSRVPVVIAPRVKKDVGTKILRSSLDRWWRGEEFWGPHKDIIDNRIE